MPTKSVKIPGYLKQKMAEHREANWSEVMRNSIYDHLNRFEKKPEQTEKTPAENKSFLADIDSKKKLYIVAGLGGLMILIAFWQYILIGGLIAGLIYLRTRRK